MAISLGIYPIFRQTQILNKHGFQEDFKASIPKLCRWDIPDVPDGMLRVRHCDHLRPKGRVATCPPQGYTWCREVRCDSCWVSLGNGDLLPKLGPCSTSDFGFIYWFLSILMTDQRYSEFPKHGSIRVATEESGHKTCWIEKPHKKNLLPRRVEPFLCFTGSYVS